jgi:hypothetical protein
MRKALTVTVDPQGNVIVAGPLSEDRSSDIFVAMLDREGRLLWQRCIPSQPLLGEQARTSSLPPPPPIEEFAAASADARDSVEPYLLADDVEAYRKRLAGKKGRLRNFVLSAFAALLVGGAMVAAAFAADGKSAGAAEGPSWMERRVVHQELDKAELGWDALELGADPFAAEPVAPASEPVAEAAAAAEVTVATRSADELRKETLKLLEAGLADAALPHAHAYVQAAPDDAMAYLCLGAALQEMGLAKEARDAYRGCVEHAKRGSVAECWALGGGR